MSRRVRSLCDGLLSHLPVISRISLAVTVVRLTASVPTDHPLETTVDGMVVSCWTPLASHLALAFCFAARQHVAEAR